MTQTTERAVARTMAGRLAEEGYEVFLEPSRRITPDFLGSYRPDIIALHDTKPNLIIEIKSRGKSTERFGDVQASVAKHPEWQFQIVFLENIPTPSSVDVSSAENIMQRVKEATQLLRGGFTGPSLILCWSILEALARLYFPDRLQKPQLPRSVIQELAADGIVDPDEADFLRALINTRNAIVHGSFGTETEERDVRRFLRIIQRVIRDLADQIEKDSDE